MSAPGRRIPVGVIEDHPLYRYALTRVLSEAPDIELGAVADSVARFAVQDQPPGSVVVLDLKLRGVQDAAAVLEVGHLGHKVLVVCGKYPGAPDREQRGGVSYRRVGLSQSYILSRLGFMLGASRLIKGHLRRDPFMCFDCGPPTLAKLPTAIRAGELFDDPPLK